VSEYHGKRTERLQMPEQLRSDPELAEAVRFISRINRRTIGLQILVWIIEGVEKEKARFSQPASPNVPKSVRGRQVQSGEREVA
jgi:hypothetical protein